MGTTAYTYDARGELTDAKTTSGVAYTGGSGVALAEFGGPGGTGNPSPMTYDAPGNRLSMQATLAPFTAYSGTTTYGYDYKDELTGETSTRNSGYTNSFAYDTVGNFTTMRGATVPAANSDNLHRRSSGQPGPGSQRRLDGIPLANGWPRRDCGR